MPRVHQGAIRRRNRGGSNRGTGGIFQLSTPFVGDTATGAATAAASGGHGNMLLLASVAARGRRVGDEDEGEDVNDDDASGGAEECEAMGGGAVGAAMGGGGRGGGQRLGNGMEEDDGDSSSSSSDVTVLLGDDGIDDEGDDACIERNDGGECEDEDDDENVSVDLLAEERGGTYDIENRRGNDGIAADHRPRRTRRDDRQDEKAHRGGRDDDHRRIVVAASDVSTSSTTTSPATQTLDRLAAFGSREGGAELVMRLLPQVDTANDANDDDDAPRPRIATDAAAASRGRKKIYDDDDDGRMDGEDGRVGEMAGASRSEMTRAAGGVGMANSALSIADDASSVAVGKDGGGGDDCDDDASEGRRRCLRALKGYFMSTKNSSEYAAARLRRQRRDASDRDAGGVPVAGVVLPPDVAVPFCRRCNHPTTPGAGRIMVGPKMTPEDAAASMQRAPPHHGLCPFHDDFYNSGSYEILNLIVDGNLLSCEACAYQFDHGRPNKELCHIDGCERKRDTRSGKKRTSGGGDSRINSGVDASNRGTVRVNDGKKSERKEMRRCDGDEDGKKNDACGRGAVYHSKISSPAVAWMDADHDVKITRRASSRVTQPSETKTRADAVNKSSIQQSSQSTVLEHGPPFEVGTVVFVRDRTWPGRNDPGGVARIVKVHRPKEEDDDDYDGDGRATYDVKYVLESRREKYVEERFISLHAMLNAYVSPSKNEHDSGLPRLENEDAFVRSSAVANKDDSSASEVVEGSSFGVGASGSTEAINSPDHVDADGHPLSEYERLRLRNIQRNKSRLAQLGLLVPPDKTSDGQPSSSSLGTKGGKRKARHEPRGADIEKRIHTKRQTATNRPEEDVMSNIPIHHSTADTRDEKKEAGKTSLAKVGGGGKENLDQRQTQPRRTIEVDHDRVKQSKQAQMFHGVCDALVSNLPAVTIAGASKTVCRNTLEWKTKNIDPRANHDVCCPRAAKTAPPSNDECRINLTQPILNGHIIQNQHNQPTPSPVPPRRKNDIAAQQRPPARLAPLPRWIDEFILESNLHNETVPAPRGSKWFPCPNPWGKIGHEDGDFVIISPFQSETAHDLLSIFHQGPDGNGIPKRFVANPLREGSPYHSTHRSPARGGYSALRLLRDRTSLRPWGFTVRLHEFGGACLVKSIEPLSPAEAAEDISGWTDVSSSSGLKLHDMIICINGKSISNLTMAELLIEFDVCGPEMMLVVSRFDIKKDANRELTTLEDLAMDWNDIGAGATRGRIFSSENDYNSGELCELDDQHGVQSSDKEGFDMDGAESGPNLVDSRNNTAKTGSQLTRDEESDVPRRLPALAHHESLSKALPKVSLSKAAESGCRKCILELKTGIKGTQSHCPSCPRKKRKQRSSEQESIHECAQTCKMGKKYGILTVHPKACGNVKPNNIIRKQPATRYKKQLDDQSDDENDILPSRRLSIKDNNFTALQENAEIETEVPMERRENNPRAKDWIDNYSSSSSNAEEECESHDDENPWLGCVCGKTHPHPIKVFWIQCESCDAWYNVAEECVGFDELTAENIDKWCCWACEPPVAGLGL